MKIPFFLHGLVRPVLQEARNTVAMTEDARGSGFDRLSLLKQMGADFRSWHVWHNEKAVYREIYTRSVSALIVAVIGYFFVALGTSLKLDPIAYLAWTILGVAVLVLVYTLIVRTFRAAREAAWRLLVESYSEPGARRSKQRQRESRRITASAVAALVGAFLIVFVNVVQSLRAALDLWSP